MRSSTNNFPKGGTPLRKLIPLLIFIFLFTGCATAQPETSVTPSGGFPYTFTDSTGASVTAAEKPQTVAVLLSSLADVWVSAGGCVDITVGEAVERGFADETAVLVDSGAGKTIDLELLIASEPDLVIYSTEIAGQTECAAALTAAGIPAAGFRVDTFDEYLSLLKICTDLTGKAENYETCGTQLQSEIRKIIAFAQNQAAQKDILFVRAGSSARYTKAKTADNNFVCKMLDDLGARNIADAAPILLDGLSLEAILTADPDVIFYTTMGDEATGTAYMESLLADPVWSNLTAVKEGRVYHLPKDLFQYKPNARWDEAYAHLAELLYGELP